MNEKTQSTKVQPKKRYQRPELVVLQKGDTDGRPNSNPFESGFRSTGPS